MRLSMEKEMTGVYISGHPLDEYADALDGLPHNTAYVSELAEREDHGLGEDGRQVKMGGMIVSLRAKATRKGSMMGFAVLEDLTGQIECLLFPAVWERYGRDLSEDTAVIITGKLSVREDEETKLLADRIVPLTPGGAPAKPQPPPDPAVLAKQAPVKLYLKLQRSQMPCCEAVLHKMQGNIPVYLNLPDEGLTLLAPMHWWCDDADDARANLLDCLPKEHIKVVSKV